MSLKNASVSGLGSGAIGQQIMGGEQTGRRLKNGVVFFAHRY